MPFCTVRYVSQCLAVNHIFVMGLLGSRRKIAQHHSARRIDSVRHLQMNTKSYAVQTKCN